MSELLNKEVNAQKENLNKYFRGSRKLTQAHEKCVIKMKERNKEKMTHVKMLLMEGSLYKVHTKNWGKRSQQASNQRFLTQ